VEQRFHVRLQIQSHSGLGNSVRNGGHAERSHALVPRFRYLHSTDRRREIAPRGHAIPELVEVPFQVLLELRDRLPVNTSGPFVGFDLLVCLPNNPLGNRKRLSLQL